MEGSWTTISFTTTPYMSLNYLTEPLGLLTHQERNNPAWQKNNCWFLSIDVKKHTFIIEFLIIRISFTGLMCIYVWGIFLMKKYYLILEDFIILLTIENYTGISLTKCSNFIQKIKYNVFKLLAVLDRFF